MWNATWFEDTVPPSTHTELQPLWELGSDLVAAAKEVAENSDAMVAAGRCGLGFLPLLPFLLSRAIGGCLRG
jgi:hypothetical protein